MVGWLEGGVYMASMMRVGRVVVGGIRWVCRLKGGVGCTLPV